MKDFALKVTVVFAILLAAVALWRLRSIVALILVSLAIAAAMRAPIASLMARGMRRGVAILLAYGVALGSLAALLVVLSYTLSGEFTQLGENIMTAYTRLQSGRRVFGRLDALLADRLPTVEELAAFLTGDQMPVVGQGVLNLTQNIGAVVGQFFLAMVLSVYWTADQVRFERFWLSLFPTSQRPHAREMWFALESQVGAYIRSEVVQSVITGFLLTLGFWLLGVDYPVLWALLISLAWFIPLVGGFIFLLPLWLMVWASDGAVAATAAVLYTAAVLALMEFFVERRLYTQTHYTHVLVIVVMLMLASAYGLVGLLLAPVLATAIEVILAKLAETPPRPAVETTPEIDVSALQARLDEVRQSVSTLGTPSTLRLANIVDRLEGLLMRTEERF
jgi:predicted PurR-regulated permease PerM